jgi:hypothetical protein
MNWKAILLSVSTLLTYSTIQAQRTCDLAVTLLQPANNAIINPMAQYNVVVNLENLGNDDLVVGDELYFNTAQMPLSNREIFTLTQGIPAGSSLVVTLKTYINSNDFTQDETSPYYVIVESRTGGGGDWIDTITNNNTSQNMVTFKAQEPSSIQELDQMQQQLSLYPSPTQDVLHLKWNGNATVQSVQMVNMVGSVVYKSAWLHNNSSVDMKDLPAGIYAVQLFTDQGIVTKQCVKQ